jgi:1-deoxy-D-xylulose-5-phosphate reductoisomerase
VGKLTFCKPDHDRFPCLALGYESLRLGGTMPATMNAANEVAVEAFLNNGIRFALETDRWAREKAESFVHALAK